MTYLNSSGKNGLKTPSERFLRWFLDPMTQQLNLLPPLSALSFSLWGGGVGCVEAGRVGGFRDSFRVAFLATRREPRSS